MIKLKAYPKDDLHLFPHTWTKGLDYEAIDKGDYITIASNEGQVNFSDKAKERLHEVFNFKYEGE